LEKILSSEEQQKWVEKMQGFDFEIIYKKGKDNVVADALSRIEEASSLYSITSSILCGWKKLTMNGKMTIVLDKKYNV
jgi:hypothetical protein